MTGRKIVFHHIPKCGGTSLARGLILTYYPVRLLLKGSAGFPGGLNVDASRLTSETFGLDQFHIRRQLLCYQLAKGNSPLIYGHYPFSLPIFERFKAEWAFITILRNPIDRWYSEYFYNRHNNEGVAGIDLELDEFLDSERGRMNARSFVNFLIEAQDPIAPATESEAREAMMALGQFDVVGHLENLNQFREDMKRRFGRRPYFPHFNRSPVSAAKRLIPDPSSSLHKKLKDLLAADLYIYEKSFDIVKSYS